MGKPVELKRKEGEERNMYYRSLTAQQKLARLDSQLGKGVGASKVRARLSLLIDRGNGNSPG